MKKLITGITGGALALGLIAGPAAYAQTISKAKITVPAAQTHATQESNTKVYSKVTVPTTHSHATKESSKKVTVPATHSHATKKTSKKVTVPATHSHATKESSKKVTVPATHSHATKKSSKKQTQKISPAKLKEVQKAVTPINKNVSKVSKSFESLEKKVANFYATPNTSSKNELDLYNSSLGKLNAYSKQLTSYKKQLDQISKKYGTSNTLTAAYQTVSELQSNVETEIGILKSFHYGN